MAKRIDRAIYWYKRGIWSNRTEEQLLHLWIALEVLIGQKKGHKQIIPYRAGLLAPVMSPVDGHTTYRQIRSWTEEFIEDVYQLRNEIVHGGVFEGPSFDRFVARFRSILFTLIFTIATPFTSNLPIPNTLEEVLAWVWYKNPDTQFISVRKRS